MQENERRITMASIVLSIEGELKKHSEPTPEMLEAFVRGAQFGANQYGGGVSTYTLEDASGGEYKDILCRQIKLLLSEKD